MRNENLQEIAVAATAATLPEFTALELQRAELTDRHKLLVGELNRANERTGLVYRSGSDPVREPEARPARQRVDELNAEIASVASAEQEVIRKIAAVRPKNAAAIRAALEPFRRRADARLLAVQAALLAALTEWAAIEAEYRRADLPNTVLPAHFIKLRTLVGFLNIEDSR